MRDSGSGVQVDRVIVFAVAVLVVLTTARHFDAFAYNTLSVDVCVLALPIVAAIGEVLWAGPSDDGC